MSRHRGVGRVRGGLCALAVGLALAGCSDDATPDPPPLPERIADYCEVVEEEQVALTEALAQGAPTGLLEALPSFERLADASPDDLVDDWTVVTDRVGALADALEDAGIDPADYDPEDPPADVGDDELAAVRTAAAGLAQPTTQDALDSVQQQARDVCKTPLAR